MKYLLITIQRKFREINNYLLVFNNGLLKSNNRLLKKEIKKLTW